MWQERSPYPILELSRVAESGRDTMDDAFLCRSMTFRRQEVTTIMLKHLKINNFKIWQEAQIDFGQITGLFGTNSSGKSSLIQFLLLLKQTKESTDKAAALDLNGRFVKLGIAKDAIHAHDEKNRLGFRLDFEQERVLRISDPSNPRKKISDSKILSVRARAKVDKGIFRSRALTYKIGDAKFRMKRKSDSDTGFDLESEVPGSKFSFIRARGRAWELPSPVKTYRFPDQARTYFQNSGFLSDLEAAFEKALDNLYHLGPLREHPERDYLWAGSRPADVGEKGERTISVIIAAQDAGEQQNLGLRKHLKPFSQIIAHWLRELGLIHSFRVEEIATGSNRWQAIVQTRNGGTEAMLTDVGIGVSQVLPVITLLHCVPEGSVVLLEQPELHLHPLAQAGLADVMVHAATYRKVQIILESHSEHLLLRLQRRIAEERIDNDKVMLYFCASPNGNAGIRRLELDEFGNIRNWPDRFMGDAFAEAVEAELARFGRMKGAAG